MRIRHRTYGAGVALVLGALMAGCSGLPGLPPQQSAPPQPPASAPPGSEPATAPPSTEPSAQTPSAGTNSQPPASTDPSGAPSEGPSSAPAATREATVKGKKLRLTLYPIRRTDTLSVLDFTISWPKTSGTSNSEYLGLGSVLGDNDIRTGDRNTFNAADGVRLVDARNRKAYLAAADDGGDCLCTNNLGSVIVHPGETYTIYTTFAAPPSGVTALDVTVPNFGSVRGVPVT